MLALTRKELGRLYDDDLKAKKQLCGNTADFAIQIPTPRDNAMFQGLSARRDASRRTERLLELRYSMSLVECTGPRSSGLAPWALPEFLPSESERTAY